MGDRRSIDPLSLILGLILGLLLGVCLLIGAEWRRQPEGHAFQFRIEQGEHPLVNRRYIFDPETGHLWYWWHNKLYDRGTPDDPKHELVFDGSED